MSKNSCKTELEKQIWQKCCRYSWKRRSVRDQRRPTRNKNALGLQARGLGWFWGRRGRAPPGTSHSRGAANSLPLGEGACPSVCRRGPGGGVSLPAPKYTTSYFPHHLNLRPGPENRNMLDPGTWVHFTKDGLSTVSRNWDIQPETSTDIWPGVFALSQLKMVTRATSNCWKVGPMLDTSLISEQ